MARYVYRYLRRFPSSFRDTPLSVSATRIFVACLALVVVHCATSCVADDFVPANTKAAGEHPLSPSEATKRLRVPAGFQVTLAAAEPDVRQPIAIAFDERGRLWVAESYSYDGSTFTDQRHDRILIFADTSGDGVLDQRTVFCDGLTHLTGLEIGFGGVWITSPPCLSFIPDRDGDDVPDGEPVVHLDGWSLKAEHNSVNGLMWGPDGWLYGRHGIKQPSLVGKPQAPESERTPLSCCIWRYHPSRHVFQVVADGTINPWGLDFDDHGQGFLTTSVVEHLWHLVPGAHYERWKDRGTHPLPYVYDLMSACSDHLHWGSTTFDRASRQAEGNSEFGGGHSHCDAMIYLGDRWPDSYRGTLLTSNIHGRRINRDRLYRVDGIYRGGHADDFLIADDPWFRAVSMEYGPDGDVYVTDWSDNGECHDRDGVHRTSGRIYKISWGEPRHVEVDLAKASNDDLVRYQSHRNEWFVRHARRVLQQRTVEGRDMTPVHAQLRDLFTASVDVPKKLRALWALYVTDGADTRWLAEQLADPNEHVRAWAVRLLVDREAPSADVLKSFSTASQTETSWLVRLSIASALSKVAPDRRWKTAIRLAEAKNQSRLRGSAVDEQNLQRMVWYAIEPAVAADPERAMNAVHRVTPSLRRWMARRVTETSGEGLPYLATTLQKPLRPKVIADLLDGINEGLTGMRLNEIPVAFSRAVDTLIDHHDVDVRTRAVAAAAACGNEATLDRIAARLRDPATDTETGKAALAGFLLRRPERFADDLRYLIETGRLIQPSLVAAATVKDAKLTSTLLVHFQKFSKAERELALRALVARKASAEKLIEAIEHGQIASSELSAEHARQIGAFDDAELSKRLEPIWGTARSTLADRLKQIKGLKRSLEKSVVNADLANGRILFKETCGACHQLFGEGRPIGPELTGGNRRSLDYLLTNIIDPSAAVAADFRLTTVLTDDGRVVSGALAQQTPTSITIQTVSDTVQLKMDEVEEIKRSTKSMMPDGLLDKLDEQQTRDLFAWLMSDGPQSDTKSLAESSDDADGFQPIFDGKTLNGWEGKAGAWSVRQGEIWCTGESKEKNWLVWRQDQPSDFVLRLEFLWEHGNSGVQVRSDEIDDFMIFGYQVEVAQRDAMGLWHHSLLPAEHPRKQARHLMATAGQFVVLSEDGSKMTVQRQDADALQQQYREHAWNQLEIVAQGDTLIQKINGSIFSTVVDRDAEMSRRKGFIALQDHGKGCRVAFRKIELMKLTSP